MAKKRVSRENFDGEYYRQKYSNPTNMNKAVAGIAQTAADEWKEYFTRERKGAKGNNVGKNQVIDFSVYKKSIECKLRGDIDFDVYIPIKFCPVCGKKIKRRIRKMKNNLNDLNDHLFIQLERLMDEDVCKDEQTTRTEIQKASAVSNIAKTILETGKTQLSALKLAHEWNLNGKEFPPLLEQKHGKTLPTTN